LRDRFAGALKASFSSVHAPAVNTKGVARLESTAARKWWQLQAVVYLFVNLGLYLLRHQNKQPRGSVNGNEKTRSP
jgi:hypothetical protein